MSFTDGLNTIVDEVEKFGTGSQIPVGTRGADMAQVGRQSCDAGINIETATVGVDEGVHRERVPQIVQPGQGAARPRRKVAGTDQGPKRCSKVACLWSGGVHGHEQRLIWR